MKKSDFFIICRIFAVMAVVVCVCIFAACDKEDNKEEILYTVTFDADGGNNIDPIKVVRGETMGDKFPSPSRAGYEFSGWYKGAEMYTADTIISNDVDLKASWKLIVIKVDGIFEIFDTFKDENYSPPSGFDTKISGAAYGTLTEKSYTSKTTGAIRKCYVYTPPGYDSKQTYPVLYLLHGIGGTHAEWLDGKPNEILSNLINSGKAKPMIVVMPNVRAMNPDSVPSNQTSTEAVAAFHNFINDLRNDLMPYMKRNYPVSKRRDECAIAGLSMGAMESLHIGIRMPETFGYIGSFSAAPAMPLTAAQMTLPDEWKDNTFFMLCCGTEDNLISQSQNYNKNLVDNGIRTAYYTITGGHDFNVWKNGLYYFARCIF